MHIQICALRCHFNWLKSFNWQQPRLKEPSVCLSCKTSFGVCLPGMQWSEYSLAANVTVALWLSVQWTCCFGEKAGGWYPTYLITDDVHHTSPTDFAASQPGEKERMLDICKQGLTDVAADDLWGSAEELCHMHATELKEIRGKAGTQQDNTDQIGSALSPLCAALWHTFVCFFKIHHNDRKTLIHTFTIYAKQKIT